MQHIFRGDAALIVKAILEAKAAHSQRSPKRPWWRNKTRLAATNVVPAVPVMPSLVEFISVRISAVFSVGLNHSRIY